MMKKSILQNFTAALVCASFVLTTGCNSSTPDVASAPATTGENDHAHDHPAHGPNNGTLIELGDEEYHAELVHDDASVTIYILDGTATKQVAIEEKELVINLLHDGAPEQFTLTANPVADDAEGMASRFTITDADLVSHLDDESAAAKLSVIINGTPYHGEVSHHDHDH